MSHIKSPNPKIAWVDFIQENRLPPNCTLDRIIGTSELRTQHIGLKLPVPGAQTDLMLSVFRGGEGESTEYDNKDNTSEVALLMPVSAETEEQAFETIVKHDTFQVGREVPGIGKPGETLPTPKCLLDRLNYMIDFQKQDPPNMPPTYAVCECRNDRYPVDKFSDTPPGQRAFALTHGVLKNATDDELYDTIAELTKSFDAELIKTLSFETAVYQQRLLLHMWTLQYIMAGGDESMLDSFENLHARLLKARTDRLNAAGEPVPNSDMSRN